MTTIRFDLDPDTAESLERYRRMAIEDAWRAWRLASCEESNGGHDVLLRFDMGTWAIVCGHDCPLDFDDFYPDGTDLLCGDLPVSINVNVVHWRATPSHGDEYDVTVDLEPRNA